MILDALNTFTALPVSTGDLPTTGTQFSSNTIDLGLLAANTQAGGTTRDIGIGDNPALKLVVQVITTFASGTSLQLALQGSVDNVTFSNFWLSPAYAEAALNAGSRLYDMDMPRPPDGIAVPRYLRMSYITVGTHTAGALYAGLVLDRDDQMYQGTDNSVLGGYPAGIVVAN